MFAGVLCAETFEAATPGPATEIVVDAGKFKADAGVFSIMGGKGRSGGKALRIEGGAKRRIVVPLDAKVSAVGGEFSFWAERWTRRNPFQFTISGENADGKVVKLFDGTKSIGVGGYSRQALQIPAGMRQLVVEVTSDKDGGLLIDDCDLAPASDMRFVGESTFQATIPVLLRKTENPVVAINIRTGGTLNPLKLNELKVSLAGTTQLDRMGTVRIAGTGASRDVIAGETRPAFLGEALPAAGELVFKGDVTLANGDNWFWVFVEPKESASIDGRVDASILEFKLSDGKVVKPAVPSPDGSQRLGVAVRKHGDSGSKFYRIPGLVATDKGTLLGVYDIRYEHAGDLPANIDVGLSRSTDGGQSWEDMKVVMDMGPGGKDGIGDPAILFDPVRKRTWVAGLWSHGNRAWHGSGQGMKPEETAQFVLVYSDDDGVTWSKPVNITSQVKKPEWHMFFQGPGAGIVLKDGTLVFPAQYQDETKNPNGSKRGMPFSTLIYSKDGGATWHSGTGVKANTTEAQVVELADGSIMINARDNRGGFRTVGVTRDLGRTWTLHETDRKALPCPVCQASILRMDHPSHGTLFFFSNPAVSGGGRYNMSIKVSRDFGTTWPREMHTLYDSRHGAGYSCLAPIGTEKVGVLYEGRSELFYMRFPVSELVAPKAPVSAVKSEGK